MGGTMDKKTVIFGAETDDAGTKAHPIKLADVMGAKESAFWLNQVNEALIDDLGYAPGTGTKQPGATSTAKDALKRASDRAKKDMKDAYVKIGVVGKDLVFRVKQKTGLGSFDIEEDGVLVKEYAAEKAKKADRHGVSRQGLSYILSKENLQKELLAFMKTEFSSENLLFWLAVEELKDAKGLLLEKEKERIWKEFIAADDAEEQAGGVGKNKEERVRVNLPASIYDPIAALAKKGEWKKIDVKNHFEKAQTDIFKLMQRDTLPRFVGNWLPKKMALPPGGAFGSPKSEKR